MEELTMQQETIREFVNDYLKTNKGILKQNKGGKRNKQYASLAIALAEAITQKYGGDDGFTIPTQPNERMPQ